MDKQTDKIFWCHGVGSYVSCNAPHSCNERCNEYHAKRVIVKVQGTQKIFIVNN